MGLLINIIQKEKLLLMLELEADEVAIKSARHFVVEEIRVLADQGSIISR